MEAYSAAALGGGGAISSGAITGGLGGAGGFGGGASSGLHAMRQSAAGRLIAELRPTGALGGMPASPAGSRPSSAAFRNSASRLGPVAGATRRSDVYTAPSDTLGVRL